MAIITAPLVFPGEKSITNCYYDLPLNGYYHDNRHQLIVTKQQMNNAGFMAGQIKSIFLYADKNPSGDLGRFVIHIGHTTDVSLNNFIPISSLNLCLDISNLSKNFAMVNNWVEFVLTTPFYWDGNRNIIIDFARDSSAYSSIYVGMEAYYDPDNYNAIGYYSDSKFPYPYETATLELTFITSNTIIHARYKVSMKLTVEMGDFTPPSEVTNLTASKIDDTHVDLTWILPTDSDFSYTKVYRDGTYIGDGMYDMFGDSTNATISHTYKVTTVDTTGNESVGVTVTYIPQVSSYPIITIINKTKTKISDETGMTTSTVTFESDQDLMEWEARADGAGQGQGLLIGSGTAVTANTDVVFDVDYTELVNGDKEYRINIYGKNEGGLWTAYEQ
jgi:hypothetical protein